MTRNISAKRRLFLLGVLVLLIGLIWVAIISPVKSAFTKVDIAILAEQAKQSRIETTLSQLQAAPGSLVAPEGLFWQGTSKALIQASFQERISAMASAFNISFNSTTPLSKDNIGPYETVALRAEGEATYTQLLEFLDQVFLLQPTIAVSALSIRNLPNRQNQNGTRVSFQITLWASIQVEVE